MDGKEFLNKVVEFPNRCLVTLLADNQFAEANAAPLMEEVLAVMHFVVKDACSDASCAARIDRERQVINEAGLTVVARGVICDKAGLSGNHCPHEVRTQL